MNGEQLYFLYVEVNEELNTRVDLWEDLPLDDQSLWNNFATKVEKQILQEPR